MHAFCHNQDPKLSRLSAENVLQEKKGIEPHISKKKKIYLSTIPL